MTCLGSPSKYLLNHFMFPSFVWPHSSFVKHWPVFCSSYLAIILDSQRVSEVYLDLIRQHSDCCLPIFHGRLSQKQPRVMLWLATRICSRVSEAVGGVWFSRQLQPVFSSPLFCSNSFPLRSSVRRESDDTAFQMIRIVMPSYKGTRNFMHLVSEELMQFKKGSGWFAFFI